MKKRIQTFIIAVTFFGASAAAQHLLPRPQEVVWHEGYFSLKKPCVVEATSAQAREMIAGADKRLQEWGVVSDKKATLRRILYTYSKTQKNKEGYVLRISPDTLEIVAAHTDGFRHALATLEQLKGKKGVRCCTISDAPAFAWRGAMIDVSRHFQSMDFLKKQVDALARYKFNRLHLHLTDAAGWRMEIKQYPRLTQLAAWRPERSWKPWWNGSRLYCEEGTPGAYGGYYTQEELRDLVAYAAERGITIVPEIEMPAHSEEVLTAYPELSCTHVPYKQADFCPGNEAVYTFLENVLREVMAVFPSADIHLGGDEAGKASWPDCPLCRKRMQEEGLRNVDELQAYLMRRMGNFLLVNGRRPIGWDEVVADTLPTGQTVMIWRDKEIAREAIRHGYDVILSPGKYCYLDGYQDDPPSQPEAMGGFQPLANVYGYDPLDGLSAEERQHVRGIQGNLWTEYIPEAADVERMLYPRLLAIAENGWTGSGGKDYADFRRRAVAEVKALRALGYNAFDLEREVGDRRESFAPVEHKGRGAKVTYNLPFNEKYCADGATSLTDGRRGGWDYGPGSAWQGFIRGKRFDVTLDLGAVQPIKRIATNFLQSSGPEIFLPAAYIISVSEDGRHFTEIENRKHQVERLVNPGVEAWEWRGKTKARYVRIQAPSGQYGGWIFVDEVEVD